MINNMRYDFTIFFEEKLRAIAKERSVLDVGGGAPFQKQMARYKDWFRGVEYKTLDFVPDYHPTIVGDIHNLPLADNVEEAIICKSVLEHVYDPARAVQEMHRVLRVGGKLLLYTHFIYPYHARPPAYSDYFRFTEEGLRHLFRDFRSVEIKKQGGYFTALMFFLPYQHKLKIVFQPICYFLDKIFKTERRHTTAGYYLYAIK